MPLAPLPTSPAPPADTCAARARRLAGLAPRSPASPPSRSPASAAAWPCSPPPCGFSREVCRGPAECRAGEGPGIALLTPTPSEVA